jgi:hypothetical protein
MRRHVILFGSLVLAVIYSGAFAQTAVTAARAKEEALASELRKLISCTSMSELRESNLYCKLSYRGLSIDFAGVNAPGGGSIYVTSMGAKQTISNQGRRCILVIFDDSDLKTSGVGSHILLRDDATVHANAGNEKARKECA